MQKFNLKFNNKGYTLLELLGVITVVVLVVTPLLYMFNNLYNQALATQVLTKANSVCFSVLDKAKYDVMFKGSDAERTGLLAMDDYHKYNIPDDYIVSLDISAINSNLFAVAVQLTIDSLQLEMKTLVYYE